MILDKKVYIEYGDCLGGMFANNIQRRPRQLLTILRPYIQRNVHLTMLVDSKLVIDEDCLIYNHTTYKEDVRKPMWPKAWDHLVRTHDGGICAFLPQIEDVYERFVKPLHKANTVHCEVSFLDHNVATTICCDQLITRDFWYVYAQDGLGDNCREISVGRQFERFQDRRIRVQWMNHANDLFGTVGEVIYLDQYQQMGVRNISDNPERLISFPRFLGLDSRPSKIFGGQVVFVVQDVTESQ